MSDPMDDDAADVALIVLSQVIDPMHEMRTWGDGSRQSLAARVALWDDVIKKAGDMRKLSGQALGDLMEGAEERIDGVGMVTRERPVKTVWKRDDCLDAMKTKVADDLALNKATGERSEQVKNVARFAISMFLKLVSPPDPKIEGCKMVDLRIDDYYSRIVDQSQWKIKIVPER